MTLHRCTICGRVAAWDPSWTWWGSHRDLDEGRPVVKVCSEPCRAGRSAADLQVLGKRVRENPDFVLEAA